MDFETQLNQIQSAINKLREEYNNHRHNGIDSPSIDTSSLNLSPSDSGLPNALADAPLATISDPSGGAVVDSQARTAIGTIIDRLQALGLIS